MSEQKQREEFNDILCEAIDTIVSARLNTLSFDKTIVCTITNVDEKNQGIYQVSDGTLSFTATSDYTNYALNTKVWVVIPGSDWTQQKTIIGRFKNEDDKPFVYNSPTGTIKDLTGNLLDAHDQAGGIAANGSVKQKLIYTLSNLNYKREIYDTLCLKVEFKTLFDNYRMINGDYGIAVKFNHQDEDIVQLQSSVDMFGNIYGYNDYTLQEQAYKILDSIETINSMDVFLIQNGEFKYIDENGVSQELLAEKIDDNTELNNILFQNLEIYLGNSNPESITPKIQLVKRKYKNPDNADKQSDTLIYSPGDINRQVELIWYTSIEAESVEWYIDTLEGPKKAENFNDTKFTFDCVPQLTFTNVYAIIKQEGSSIQTNSLRFENKADKNGWVFNSDLQFSLKHGSDSNDTYVYTFEENSNYDEETAESQSSIESIEDQEQKEDAKIATTSEADREHHVILNMRWSRGKLEELPADFWKGTKLSWIFPTESTMVLPKIRNYTVIIGDVTEEMPLSFYCSCPYYIAKEYLVNSTNNTIKCNITLPEGKTYDTDNVFEATIDIKFILDNLNAIKVNNDNIYTYVDAQEYITAETTFAKLTNDGQIKGIFPEYVKDTKKIDQLLINADYISTGILRSNNWEADEFIYKNGEIEKTYKSYEEVLDAIEAGDAVWEGENVTWNITTEKGSYWNLNNGQLFAKDFELNALTINNNNQSGLYLNSSPIWYEKGVKQPYLFVGDTEKGYMKFENGNLIVKGQIEATSGDIAGWGIKSNYLLSPISYQTVNDKKYSNAFRINCGGANAIAVYEYEGTVTPAAENAPWPPDTKDGWKLPFKVTYNGELHANRAYITGEITATSLNITNATITGKLNARYITGAMDKTVTIGGWSMDNNKLYATNNTNIFLSSTGDSQTIDDESVNIVFQAEDSFKVSNTGILYATGAQISGPIQITQGGNIGGWSIESNSIENGIFGIYKNGGNLTFPQADPKSPIVLKTTQETTFQQSSEEVREYYTIIYENNQSAPYKEMTYSIDFKLPGNGTGYSIEPAMFEWINVTTLVSSTDNCRITSVELNTDSSFSTTGRGKFIVKVKSTDDLQFGVGQIHIKCWYTCTIFKEQFTIPAFAVTQDGFTCIGQGRIGSWYIGIDGLYSERRKSYITDSDEKYIATVLTPDDIRLVQYDNATTTSGKRIKYITWERLMSL